MTIIQFFRLIRKHLLIIIGAPLLLAILVYIFTANQPKVYESKATFYTGLASGYNVGSDISSKVDYNATKIAFDNFISIMNSRNVKEEVALKLFATHLMLDEYDPRLISQKNFREFQKKVPDKIKELVVENDLQATIENLKEHKKPEDGNFIYELLNYVHPHYSVKAISKVKAERVNNSDLVELTYESDDPGICRLTLKILAHSFTDNYKSIKANRTDEVISYFERQLEKAAEKLKEAEQELLEFNQENNIINYYEQTKFIADQKEKLDVEIQRVNMERAAAKASIKRIEAQLPSTSQIQLNSKSIINLRDSLSKVKERIALLETTTSGDSVNIAELSRYQQKRDEIIDKLSIRINELHALGRSKEGIDREEVLSAWLEKVIEFEGIKGKLKVLENRKEEFLDRYKTFAPLGATLKRIERHISVSEREYLSILKSLGQARLKEQNIKLQSDIKLVSEPYFPINPEPSRRKLLVLAAAVVGFVLVLFIIFLMEYFDATLRYPERAERKTGLNVASVFPRLSANSKTLNFNFVKDRLISILYSHINETSFYNTNKQPPAILLFYSNHTQEGKTTILHRLAEKIKEHNQNYILLNHQDEDSTTTSHSAISNEYFFSRDQFANITTKEEFVEHVTKELSKTPEFIIIEPGAIIPEEYPLKLLKWVDTSYCVARANRLWSDADRNALKHIERLLPQKPHLILNGAELDAVESILGEVPKKRSKALMMLKKGLKLQFYSQSKIQ
ncbi:MAG: hypothetical protein K9I29_01490 [Bacteroidales bacterium]|nr:hypothetical protein [Bacteroidales bacterium]MCF8326943.1 hypothetical protein [Bacteroidales bacterium]